MHTQGPDLTLAGVELLLGAAVSELREKVEAEADALKQWLAAELDDCLGELHDHIDEIAGPSGSSDGAGDLATEGEASWDSDTDRLMRDHAAQPAVEPTVDEDVLSDEARALLDDEYIPRGRFESRLCPRWYMH